MSDQAKINHARNRRLRRRMLRMLYDARGGEYGPTVSGRMLADLFGPQATGTELCGDDGHVRQLLGDLSSAGLVLTTDEREYQHQDPNCLDYLSFSITDTGCALIEESAPKHPLVDDQRI